MDQKTQDALGRILELERQLNARYYERPRPIRGAMLAVLCRESFVTFGPPGTGKTEMVQALSDAVFGAERSFYTQMSAHSTPEDLFGGMDLPAFKNGTMTRMYQGSAWDAPVVILDEGFKAPPSIRNTLLDNLARRKAKNFTQTIDIPLETCAIMSNEYPESKDDAAFYDRFILRFWVDYIQDDANILAFLSETDVPPITATIAPDDIATLRAALAAIPWGTREGSLLKAIKAAVEADGFRASDRTWRKATKVIRAQAVLAGRDRVMPADFGILADMLWSVHTDRDKLAITVGNAADPFGCRIEAIMDGARAAVRELPAMSLLTSGQVRKTEMMTNCASVKAKVASCRDKLLDIIDEAGERDDLVAAQADIDAFMVAVEARANEALMYREKK